MPANASTEHLRKVMQNIFGEEDDDHMLYEPIDETTKRISEMMEYVVSLDGLEEFIKAKDVNRRVTFLFSYTSVAGLVHGKRICFQNKDDVIMVFDLGACRKWGSPYCTSVSY